MKKLQNICKNIIIQSIDEYTNGINVDLKKNLYNKIDITEFSGSYTCLLESFSIFYKNGIFELSIPYTNLFEYIEKNIELYYKIIDITHNKYNRWMIIKFI